MKSKSSQNDIEKARKELILLYLGIKLRKETDVIHIYYFTFIGFIPH